jgi:hypothetical protein
MQPSSLTRFVIKVFLYLPLCYFVWYFFANQTTVIAGYLTEQVLKPFFPQLILGVEQVGHNLEVIVKATLPANEVPRGMVPEIPIPVNPLKYNFGLPLCVALILASPDSLLKHLRNCVISLLFLLPIQIWGICFDFLKSLFLQTPCHLIGNMTLSQWQLEVIGISYQAGSLVFPAVIPIIIWLLLYKAYVVTFIPEVSRVRD